MQSLTDRLKAAINWIVAISVSIIAVLLGMKLRKLGQLEAKDAEAQADATLKPLVDQQAKDQAAVQTADANLKEKQNDLQKAIDAYNKTKLP